MSVRSNLLTMQSEAEIFHINVLCGSQVNNDE